MIQEFFAQYADLVSGISLGTVALVSLSVMKFFKKDRYVLPFVNEIKSKANGVFGVANVTAFLNEAKTLKVSEVKPAIKDYANRFLRVEQILELMLSNQIALGVLDNNPELKEKAEQLL